MAEHGHNQWAAFKNTDMKYWGVRDDLGFAMLTMDEDGWRTKRIAETLNLGEAVRDGREQEGGDMPIGEHLNAHGRFVSDKYLVCDPDTGVRCENVIPIKISARTAPLLWMIAEAYANDRPIFAADLKQAIVNAGFG